MNGVVTTAKLADIAELNPTLAASLGAGDEVSFIPMSAVDAESVTAVDRETRLYSEVSKGYTPFLEGDLLVAKITPCFENGKIAQVHLTRRFGFGSTEFHVIRPHAGRADARYLVHFLRQDRIRRQGEARMTGSAGQRRVPESFLAGVSVPLPPLPEQRRIAEILDKADALRAKRRAALAQLDTLTQSIFRAMFGRSEGNDFPLGQHATRVTKGTTPTTVGYSFADSGIPLLRVQNLGGDKIDFSEDVLYISEATHQALSRSQIRPGDVLTTIAGTIGRTVVVPASAPPANCNQAIAIITPRESLNSLYLCHWLRSGSAIRQMTQGQVTATISNLSLGQIKSLKILVPSTADQRRFADRAEAVHRAKAAHESALVELNALFASLQHRAFRGEL
ncbi:MAG: restriction endonuclease subunit S [Gemmatimonadales bacterium]|nr:restriction endonuclease subunit S [Gemmatimonadales bacterium]